MDVYLIGGILTGLLFIVLSGVFLFFYLKNLSDLLKAVQPSNRRIAPEAVWLLLLGLLNIVVSTLMLLVGIAGAKWLYWLCVYSTTIFVVLWQFRIVYRIADSIEAEYDSRSIPIEHRPTFQTGMFMAVAKAVTLVAVIPGVALLSYLANIAYFIGIIVYWSRTHKYKKELQAMGRHHSDTESLIFKDL